MPASLLAKPVAAARCILVIDDEPDFCTVVKEILELYGFRVYSAYSVAEALALLEKMRPDLILTDVMMP
ncbi:MAG TPA: response regulator, partial [Anaerolineales bacterium]